MAVPVLAPEQKEERRNNIIQAAWRCAGRKGFHELTIDEICDEAGVSKGSFYGYFESKQELLVALLDNDEVDVAGYRQELDRMAREISNEFAAEADEPASTGTASRPLPMNPSANKMLASDPAKGRRACAAWAAESIFVDRDFYVQTLSDDTETVLSYSVTTRDRRFCSAIVCGCWSRPGG